MPTAGPASSDRLRDAEMLIEKAIAGKPRAQAAWALLPGENRDHWRRWVGQSIIRRRRRRRASEFARGLDLLPSYANRAGRTVRRAARRARASQTSSGQESMVLPPPHRTSGAADKGKRLRERRGRT